MTKICQEFYFLLIEIVLPFTFALFLFQHLRELEPLLFEFEFVLQFLDTPVSYQGKYKESTQNIKNISINRPPDRGLHKDPDRFFLAFPKAIITTGLHFKSVIARVKIGIHCRLP